jgi:glycosyltransferase involved in cell wall biosynthesis
MTIWIDVEDLFHYSRLGARPSGIQRLSFELYKALRAIPSQDIRFVRHDQLGQSFRTTSWDDVCLLYERMAYAPSSRSSAPPGSVPKAPKKGTIRKLAQRLPREFREPLGQAIGAQAASLRALWRSIKATPSLFTPLMGNGTNDQQKSEIGEPLAHVAKPGDFLCVFGSPWFHDDYGALVERTKRELGLRFSLLIYDLIPIVRPEFVVPNLSEHFSKWYSDCMLFTDRIFVISNATARDVEAWRERAGLPLTCPVLTIPIGTGFTADGMEADADTQISNLPHGLIPGGYVLFVSTIEVRKNHALVFRAWRRLLEELSVDQVPKLVFAGRVGWLVEDLMQQIENSRYLDGAIVVIEGATDSELAALYRGCRFTVFPSYYEGWGLPVTESLSFGKTCIASSEASVPEAGGEFCLYIDPDNVTEATNLLRRVIQEPGIIENLEKKIGTNFRPVHWSEAANVVIKGLE